MARDNVETFIYILRAGDGEVLYVGITDDVQRRFRQHARAKEWWPQVRSRAVLSAPDRRTALLWEAALIETLLPQFNLTGQAHEQWKAILHDGIDVVAARLGMPA